MLNLNSSLAAVAMLEDWDKGGLLYLDLSVGMMGSKILRKSGGE